MLRFGITRHLTSSLQNQARTHTCPAGFKLEGHSCYIMDKWTEDLKTLLL